MKELQPRNERAFQLDQWMALHQKLCWAMAAGLVALGAGLVVWLAPRDLGTYITLGLALGMMLAYRWSAGAPVRALREWARRVNAARQDRARETAGAFLDFLRRLEDGLPSMQKKELAYLITINKAALLHSLGRSGEALALLRAFDQIWDRAQADRIAAMIQRISEETSEPTSPPNPSADAEPKEPA